MEVEAFTTRFFKILKTIKNLTMRLVGSLNPCPDLTHSSQEVPNRNEIPRPFVLESKTRRRAGVSSAGAMNSQP
jgi:hypothetical protein